MKALMNRLAVIGFVLTLLYGASASAGEEVATVITKGYKFIPQEITVKVGTTVRWVNKEKRQYHSVYFNDLKDQEDSDYFFPDESRERTFDKPGTYHYYCEPHLDAYKMVGVVHVVE